MNSNSEFTQLELMVLALVRKSISMSRVVEEGYTPGQIARALLALEERGLILDGEAELSLSSEGVAALATRKLHLVAGDWVTPLEGARIAPTVSIFDVYLPRSHNGLD